VNIAIMRAFVYLRKKIASNVELAHKLLRHDGIDYGDYIEQLTYLLFLNMIEEKGAENLLKNQN